MNDLFDGKSIPRTYFKFCLPLVFSMVIGLIYSIVDTYFIAQTDNTYMVAGITLCSPLMTFLMAFGNIYGQGGISLMARLLGADDKEGMKRVSSFCFYMSIITGLLIGTVLLVFRNPILILLGATNETLEYASQYYTISAVGAIPNILTYVHTNLLRAEGCSAESMWSNIGGAVLKIVLCPIFISVLGWGAKGAAYTTVLGYLCTVILSFIFVRKKSRNISVDFRKIRISRYQTGQIFVIGITAAITNIAQSLCGVLLNRALLPYGEVHIAAMGMALRVVMIVFMILIGFSFGSAPLFGFLYGAGNFKKLKQLIRFCLSFMSTVALLMSVIIFIGADSIMGRLMKDSSIISLGSNMIRWQIITVFLAGIVTQMTVLFQAIGKATASFILSMSRQGVIFIAVLYVSRMLFGYNGVIASQAVSDVISCIIALVLYRSQFKSLYASYGTS